MLMNNLLVAFGLAGSITPAAAFFRMSCPGRVARERLDPIVNPGGVSGHVHTISGGSAFGASMTFQQARSAKCSSCEIKEDMSNYWTPQLYVKKKDGTFTTVPVVGDGNDSNGGMTVYYLQRGEQGEKLKAFPEGFRMLAGDPFKRSFSGGLDAKAVNFNCLGANKPETNEIPNYNCPGGLRAQIFFPACWNGKDLDSADHKSHMSYPVKEFNNGACPPNFPVHMISIFYEVLYDTSKFVNEWNGNQHPFVFANGDTTGYGMHGDFVNGWDINVLQKAVDTCTNLSGNVKDCGAVTMYTAAECNACKLPPVINEQVDGNLKQLPGCNAVTGGPARAQPAATCPAATATLGAPATNYVDLTTTKKWEYTGCGGDNYYSRSFTGKNTASDDMTVEKCVDFCSGAGFTYAGLEYGRECYCDNKLNPATAPKDGVYGSCSMKCAGNNKQLCGNAGAMSIYHKCGSACKNNQPGSGAVAAPPAASVPAVKPSSVTKAAAPPATNKPASTIKPTSTKPSSVKATPTKAPDCPRNNCVNQIFNPTASGLARNFCATYTKTINNAPTAIPTYLNNCKGNPTSVSSACACLMYPTNGPKVRRHPRDM